MKTTRIKSGILAVLAVFTIALSAHAGKKPIDVKKSTIKWVGKKVTGEHNGTINFKEGDVELKQGKLVGGSFTVNMNTINVQDLEGEYKGKLEGHLKSDDFFGVATHPTATFVITSVEGNTVKGDLSIKGHTEKKAFTLTKKGNTISGDVKIDRTKFDIRYGSASFFDNLKDKAINDEFELSVNIVF
ncbi:polyisoprenoid-binding protein YceI [Wenyingzhuangia heitensis]|uniref:Polyisoprenoid-binding protein YceI n=1 Tax=Wenyingzhuangia heitensis TaxID=1487859 RepID=A0ABX0UBA2_9FLAO|nr:YceI family protein [Wenyingzhuangia heitensis]NIJ46099.1 polyisoprenoid-binding protein YceI [Wenyingzhuangia heitensis]